MAFWERVADVFRRAPNTPPPGPETDNVDDGTGDIIPELPIFRQFQRIGGNLTPQQVSEIIQEGDVGIIQRLVDLSNEARQKDGHLHGVLQTRELALKTLPWSLEPPEEPTAEEERAAKNVQSMLRGSENLPDLIVHLTGAVFHGHSTAETMNRKDSGWVVPERWKLISPRRFCFSQAQGKLLWTDTGSDVDGVDLMSAHPGKFIQYQPRVNGDVPAREGLARLLLWAALFRNWTLRDWLALGEIGWKPQRLGTYQKGADKKDIDALKRAVSKLMATGAATLPETTKVETTYPGNGQRGGAQSSHKELFDTMGAEMSKAVLGQTSTTEAGPNGDRAATETRDKVRGDILISDAIGEASIITRHVVRPLYALNFRDRIRPGNFIFHTEDSIDLQAFSAAVKNFADAGLRVPSAWIRRQGGIPEPQDDEEVIGATPEPDDDPEDPKDDEGGDKKPAGKKPGKTAKAA